MNNLNIIQLIEQNPLTRLSTNYQGKFVEKIQQNFTETQQQLFIASFYCYLNYSKTDFVIDLEDIWKSIGFSRKNDCKKVLTKNFTQDTDYKIIATAVAVKPTSVVGPKNLGGRPKEQILMTIDTFKMLCLISKTDKGKEIRSYFIKLEETFQEVINEESNELKLQLTTNKQLLLENQIQNVKEKHETLVFSYNKKSIVYIIKITINDKVYYKFGYTDNIKKRINELKRLMKCDLLLVFCIESKDNVKLENKLKQYFKTHNNEKCKRITLDINNYEYTEIIDTLDATNICSLLIDFNKDIGEDSNTKKDILKLENKKYDSEREILNLKIQFNEMQRQAFYTKELEEKLVIANKRIDELEIELARFRPVVNDQNSGHFSNEIYENFVNEYCELDPGFKCSGKDLLMSFKDSLQNTIYEAKINSYYDEIKYTSLTNYFLASFKRNFYEYFENKLNYKASGMKFRDVKNQTSKNSRGFFGIRLKNIDQTLYEDDIYKDFLNKKLVKDSYENIIKTKDLVELFINYLEENNIKVKFKKFSSTTENILFMKEFLENISNYFNIKEQRIQFPDCKASRPGFHYLMSFGL
jgi:phage anti-repressor protein